MITVESTAQHFINVISLLPLLGFKLAHRLRYRDNSFNNDSEVINSIFPKKAVSS